MNPNAGSAAGPGPGFAPWSLMTPDAARARVTTDPSRPERLSEEARLALRTGGDEALADAMRAARVDEAEFFGSDGFGFDDFLDIVNPLQHLPVVSHVYRAITGDQIEHGSRLIGGAVFGGPAGFGTALGNVILKDHSGRDVGEHVTAFLTEEDADSPDIDGGPTTVLASGDTAAAEPAGSAIALPPVPPGPVVIATLAPPGEAAPPKTEPPKTAPLNTAALGPGLAEPSDAEIFSGFSAPPRRQVAPETARLLDALAENQAAPSARDRVVLAAEQFTASAVNSGAPTPAAALPARADGTPTLENPFLVHQTSGRRVDIATSPLIEEAIRIARSNLGRDAESADRFGAEPYGEMKTASADFAVEAVSQTAPGGAEVAANPALAAQAARAYAASTAAASPFADTPARPARSIASVQTAQTGPGPAPLHTIPGAMLSALERYDALKAEAG